MGCVCLCGTVCQTVTKIFQLSADDALPPSCMCVFVSLCPSSRFVIYLVTPLSTLLSLSSILLGLSTGGLKGEEITLRRYWKELSFVAGGLCSLYTTQKRLRPKYKKAHYQERSKTQLETVLSPKTAPVAIDNTQNSSKNRYKWTTTGTCIFLFAGVLSLKQLCNSCMTSITKWNC